MRKLLITFCILLVALMVLYFSWLTSPRLSLNVFVPNWIANWTDSHDNDNVRTAIPLVVLGILSGVLIIYNKMDSKWWLRSWVLMALLVVLAEIGQLFLPLRSFDWFDIIWGIIGSGMGLLMVYVWQKYRNQNKII